ncbi:MAG: peroxiredoxin family protein [Gemmataceae bacterium]
MVFVLEIAGAKVLTVFLLACLVAPSQTPAAEPSAWLLTPRLQRGQELVYQGIFSEETSSGAVEFRRDYRLETRVLVMDVLPSVKGPTAHIAFLTTLRQQSTRNDADKNEGAACSVRLELANLSAQGKIIPVEDGSLVPSLTGPPTVECGAFVETPAYPVGPGSTWAVADAAQRTMSWQVVGTESVHGTSCLKLSGEQKSPDWDHPRADSSAWRRRDTVWLAPRTGVAYRVERVIERREPARRDPSERSTLRYELHGSLNYPGQLLADRKREIELAQRLNQTLAPLLPRAGEVGPRPFEAVLARIAHHVEHQAPTPYRAALDLIQRRAEAGRQGESPPLNPAWEASPVAQIITLGRPAPDFLVPDYTAPQSARLYNWLGQPILLIFYSPTSPTVQEVLGFGRQLRREYGNHIVVLGLAMSEDKEQILKQRQDLRLDFPILSGTGLRLSYKIETTPKLVVLDAAGIVRGSWLGWGPEAPVSVKREIERWLRKE